MMNTKQLSELLLHYGRIITDDEFEKIYDNGYIQICRIRIFSYNGKHFYHNMINGKVIKCFELK